MQLQPVSHSLIRIRIVTDTANDKIEMVQRRAARFVTNDYGRTSSVTEMIANLGWDTLQKCRNLARLSMMYRIVHELVDIPAEPYLTPSTSMARGHDSRFNQIRTSKTTYQHSSTVVSTGLHRGSTGAPLAYNRGTSGCYRGITVDNLGSNGPYRHEPGLHRAGP